MTPRKPPKPTGGAPAEPERPAAPIGGLRRVGLHDHVGQLLQDDAEAAAAAGAFLALGLERRERCVHFAEAVSASRILPHVRAAGHDGGQALASGALTLDTRHAGRLRSGLARPAELLAVLEAALQDALRAGYEGLRVSGEFAWAVGRGATLDRLHECEHALKRLFRDRPLAALFQYDRRRCPPAPLAGALRMHPFVLLRGEVHRNCLFAPPPEAARPGAASSEDAELEHALRLIAERDRAEAAYAQSGQRLRQALEGGAHALWDWDLATQRIGLHRRWAEAPGLEAAQSSVQVSDWEQVVHPDDLGPLWQTIQRHLAGELPRLEHEYRVRDATGRWRWVVLRGRTVQRDGARQPVRLAGTLTDVTELRARHGRSSAAERLGAIGALAAGVAHEINNPLAWVTANIDHVQERLTEALAGDLPASATAPALLEILGETRQGAARIRNAVWALRSLLGPVSGGVQPADVREQLQAAIDDLRPVLSRRARLALELPAALPPVRAHPALPRVFANLLVHAHRSVPRDLPHDHEIGLTARASPDRVIVEIWDTGDGVSLHDREHTFEVFASGDALDGGIRLPLPFSRMIVEASGGHLEFLHDLPGRTVARLELPVARPTCPAPLRAGSAA